MGKGGRGKGRKGRGPVCICKFSLEYPMSPSTSLIVYLVLSCLAHCSPAYSGVPTKKWRVVLGQYTEPILYIFKYQKRHQCHYVEYRKIPNADDKIPELPKVDSVFA